MKTIKDSITNIFNNLELSNSNFTINILQDAIFRTNKIVNHSYNFLKLYVLFLYSIGENIPFIDDHLIRTIMNVVSFRVDNRGPNSIMNE